MSDYLWPHESQHTRLPCPSSTPGVYSDSCPSSRWCHPATSSFVVPFSSCPQSLSASVFSNESTLCMRWPKYCSFSFSIILSKEHPGLNSFRMDGICKLKIIPSNHDDKMHVSFPWDVIRYMKSCSGYFKIVSQWLPGYFAIKRGTSRKLWMILFNIPGPNSS